MTSEDASEIRRRLNEVLTANGFAWVVDQSERHIAEGKSVSKLVSEREIFRPTSEFDFAVRAPRRRSASLLTSEPYSDEERLEILLKGIEAAILQRSNLEDDVLDALGRIGATGSVEFRPDEVSGDIEGGLLRKSHRIDRSRRASSMQLRERLAVALMGLRRRDYAGA